MNLPFYKYHGTGNDFVLIDNRAQGVTLTSKQVAMLCHRRMGIGADGLMLLQEVAGYDFEMVYYNADGGRSSMCGNGGRCIAAFAQHLGIVGKKAHFLAYDGGHHAIMDDEGLVSLHMKDVSDVQCTAQQHYLLDTGSPHYVQYMDAIDQMDVVGAGRKIRNSEAYQKEGINVNFVQQQGDTLFVRTYERGVEDETMSCGTGVTAAAIAAAYGKTGRFSVVVNTPGGQLQVSFYKPDEKRAIDVWLKGPAVQVFSGLHTVI